MKYLLIFFCFLLFMFSCQSDSTDDVENINNSGAEYGEAIYGESIYGVTK